MTNDEEFIVMRYRASLEEVRTPELDQRILTAAHRRVVQRRVLRASGGAMVVVGIVFIGIRVTSHHDDARARIPLPNVTNYGAIEGATRSYLLRMESSPYSGPGLTEGR
jgi:hypothetical protein